nr:hypothetical protein CFP56_18944 [Quercus suber]
MNQSCWVWSCVCVGFSFLRKGIWFHFWYFRLTHYSHQTELFDSKVGTNLLDIISQRWRRFESVLDSTQSFPRRRRRRFQRHQLIMVLAGVQFQAGGSCRNIHNA